MALLLWCYLSAGALFTGTAVAAQLEALRAGLTEPVLPDPGLTLEVQRIPDGRTVVDQRGQRRGL